MDYILGAIMGAAFAFGGFMLGRRQPARVETEEEEKDEKDLAIKPGDSKKERRRKVDAQIYNLMTYNGEAQR